MKQTWSGWIAVVCLVGAGCASNAYLSKETAATGRLSTETLLRHASAGPLTIERARIITGNDDAFRSKLEMVEHAQSSIDASYYIFADDLSSSVLAQALIAAAKRGVRVRLLLDYHTNYRDLDLYSMMEQEGSRGTGSLEVRFYNRPTREMILDAAYLTMGCSENVRKERGEACSAAKFAEIQSAFADEMIDGRPAADLNISNLNVASSGLFLSGIYGKKPDVLAMAVVQGQDLDIGSLQAQGTTSSPEEREAMLRAARVYWSSRTAPPLRRLVAKLQLSLAFALYGDRLNPVYELFTSYLPVERPRSRAAERDWEYLTDFTHHKLLLVDDTHVHLGGRNVEDSYHMRPNALVKKYTFNDTDLRADLTSGGDGIRRSFDELWNFRTMVATLAEVRMHAPNEFVANIDVLRTGEKACAKVKDTAERTSCIMRAFERDARPLDRRIATRLTTMQVNAKRYWKDYPYAKASDPSPTFDVDRNALLAYVENLPFYGKPGTVHTRRSYGAVDGQEALWGKRIHALWLAGLENACRTATNTDPKWVVFHNAYFLPPGNVLAALARMVNGSLDCHNVTFTVLTNSIDSTDLKVVNLLARHTAKAFAEYAAAHRVPERSARVELYEYGKAQGGALVSLHTKVEVLGSDLMVGSANADVRSYIRDSNNAMVIRGAPAVITAYDAYLDKLMRDTTKTRHVTDYYLTTSREQMLTEDRQTFEQLVAKYRADRWLDPAQIQSAEQQFVELLDLAYNLAREIMEGGSKGREAQERFNRIFKAI